MNDLQSKVQLLQKKIVELKKMVFVGDVTWESVSFGNWGVGETKIISDCINFKFFESDDVMSFFTEIPPKGEFNGHKHSEFDETNFVLEGVYIDRRGEKYRGEWIDYSAGTYHWVVNPSKTEWLKLIVVFSKKKIKS